jgi:hypothetical protein
VIFGECAISPVFVVKGKPGVEYHQLVVGLGKCMQLLRIDDRSVRHVALFRSCAAVFVPPL